MRGLAPLRDISIRWKLAGLITLVSGIALIAVAAGLLLQDARSFRTAFTRQISTLADIVATNSEVALLFDDEKAAAEVLESLAAEPRVLVAILYSRDQVASATYFKEESATRLSDSCRSPGSGEDAERSILSISRDIVWLEEPIGRLCLVAGTDELNAHLRRGLKVTGFVLLAAIAATFLLSMVFQRVLSRPILELAGAAQAIAQKDYDVQVPARANDEMGSLARTFNRMVREIKARDVALVDTQIELERQVKELNREIAERERAEEALQESEEALRQAQKMEAIGLLAGGIAHDFNNLMTAVLGYSDLILEGPNQSEELRLQARQINAAGVRAADLTKQLLAFSRKQILDPEIIDLNGCVTKLRDIMERLIGEDTVFKFDLSPDLGMLRADLSQIEQVLLNLVVNARDAMSTGGTIEISTSMGERTSGLSPARSGETNGRCVKLSVRDTGCGMDAETQEKIFEPFFSTKAAGKGTGLGLSTVFGIVKQSGGEIVVDSMVGEGTTFTVCLPAVALDTAHQDSPPVGLADGPDPCGEPRAEARSSATVLVVEDQPTVKNLAVTTLELAGYTVLAAADGETALALSRSYPQPIDLLLTDVVMPGMNGCEVAQLVTADRPEMCTLFMTGYATRDVVSQGVLVDGVDLLHKPFSPSELRQRVIRALRERAVGAETHRPHAGRPSRSP